MHTLTCESHSGYKSKTHLYTHTHTKKSVSPPSIHNALVCLSGSETRLNEMKNENQ